MLFNYLQIAVRNLLHNKFQTILSIVGLSVAFFCFGFCAYFIHGFAAMDTYYANHDRVLSLMADHKSRYVCDEGIEELQRKFPEVEAAFRYYDCYYIGYKYGDKGRFYPTLMVCDTTLQALYNPALLAGTWEAAKKAANSFVMCESTARRLFGGAEEAIGQQFIPDIHRDGKTQNELPVYTVRAVVEDLAYNSTLMMFSALDAWVLNDEENTFGENNLYQESHRCNILLREGVDKADFCSRLQEAGVTGDQWRLTLDDGSSRTETLPLTADPTWDEKQFAAGADDTTSLILFVLLMVVISVPGVLILLSALSNFFHILLSNIMMRRREYTLRRAHGAHTFDLWVMVSTQVVVTLLLVGFCTLLIVELCAPLLSISMAGKSTIQLDTHEMLLQSFEHIVVLLVIGLLVAWLAVARIRKDSLQEAMKTSTGRRPGKHIGRNLLMGWQMTIGLFFLTLLAAVMLQIEKNEESLYPTLSNQEKREIVTIRQIYTNADVDHTKPLDYTEIHAIEAELRAIPSIQYFVLESSSYLDTYSSEMRLLKESGDTIQTHFKTLHTAALDILNIRLKAGQMPANSLEVLVDENFVARHHLTVGDKLVIDPSIAGTVSSYWMASYDQEANAPVFAQYVTIVGVIDNAAEMSVSNLNRYDKHMNCVYSTSTLSLAGHWVCRSYPGKSEEMRRDIKKMLVKRQLIDEKMDCNLPSLADEIRTQNRVERTFIVHFWLFAGIALIITLLGIYSAITMDTTARRKEMAIRKINGAKTWHIALRFSRLYIMLLAISSAIAFPLCYILIDYLGEMGYRETFNYGPLFFLSVLCLMALFVALTVGAQIYRIAHINPAEIVKSE